MELWGTKTQSEVTGSAKIMGREQDVILEIKTKPR